MMPEQTRSRGRQTVALTPNARQSQADVDHDFAIAFRHGERMTERGTESYKSFLRWWGPIKVMVYKEVGPPPWRWPRAKIEVDRKRPFFVRFLGGWKSTAYALCLMWAGRATSASEVQPPNAAPASDTLGAESHEDARP